MYQQTNYSQIVIAAKNNDRAPKKARMAAGIYTKKGRLISLGVNVLKTHPKQRMYHILSGGDGSRNMLHAEVSAIARLPRNGDVPYSMTVIRYMKSGKLGNSKPCDSCMLAIKEVGIKIVWFYNGEMFERIIL